MKFLKLCAARLRALFRKQQMDREMNDEMRFHLEMQIKDNLEAGMSPEQARTAAWRSFGGLEQVKEVCREGRGVAWVEKLWQDVRYGTRQLLKNPGVTAVVVVALALGIGANTVVFTWIRGTLLESIPGVKNPGDLVVVAPLHHSTGLGENMSIPDIESVRAERGEFAGVTASQMGAVPVRIETTSQWLWGQTTLANYFDVLGIRPVLGRGFLPGEDHPGSGEGVAVISHSLWRQRFGGSPGVLGRVIQVNQAPVTIVGVAPPEFHGSVGGLVFDLWVPLATESGMGDLKTRFTDRGGRWLQTIARLSDGVSLHKAQAALDVVGKRVAHEFPATNKETTFTALRLWESPWGGQALFLPILRVLAVVGGLLLLLVITNTANLLLARGLARQREMAVRLALGSSAGRLTRQVLTESLLLAILGGAAGLLFALWGRRALLALMPPSYLPIGYDLRLSAGVFGLTAGLTLMVGLMVGLAPAWRAVRVSLSEHLKALGGGTTVSSPHVRLRHVLVIGQIALALVLLLGMGLCVRSYSASRKMNIGFNPSGVWLAGFRLNPHSGSDQSVRAFFRRLQAEATRLPGVESTALSSYIPLGIEGIDLSGIKVPGYTPSAGESMNAGIEVVSPGYFKTMQVRLVSGREFADSDDESAARAAVVNETFSKKYFAGRDPVGLTFDTGRGEARIVGVTKTGKYRSLGEPALPYVYLCAWQHAERNLTIALRTSCPPSQIHSALARLAVSLDPNAPPHAAMSCEDYVRSAFTVPRVAVTLLSFLGLVAMLLAVMGMYAVISHNVSQRLREFGVRMALGAQPGNISWLVVRQGLRLVAVGIGLGAVIGVAINLLMAGILVGVSATDLTTWLVVPLVLVAAVLAACWFPVRRAVRSQPLLALRCE